MNKTRFGDIRIGQEFVYSGLKMKKIDAVNAVTVSDLGKRQFMFGRRDLVMSAELFIPKVMSVLVTSKSTNVPCDVSDRPDFPWIVCDTPSWWMSVNTITFRKPHAVESHVISSHEDLKMNHSSKLTTI
jgi:hypothetical protein